MQGGIEQDSITIADGIRNILIIAGIMGLGGLGLWFTRNKEDAWN